MGWRWTSCAISVFSPPVTDARARLGTVEVSEQPNLYLVPLMENLMGNAKTSHLDNEKNSQVVSPVKPEEAFLGQPRGSIRGEGLLSPGRPT